MLRRFRADDQSPNHESSHAEHLAKAAQKRRTPKPGGLAALLLLVGLVVNGRAADPGFHPIFDGSTLKGWDGEPGLWSAGGGILQGQSHGLLFANSFLIYRGGTPRDFDLKFQVRLTNGNSGLQYRSRIIGPWTVSGYQCEIANEPGKAGFLYEERGRKFVALLGQSVAASPSGHESVVALLGTKEQYFAWGYYRPREWNAYEIVARGPYMAHYVNGFKTAEFFDEDANRAAPEGVLALQIHAGTTMTVEFKDIVLKTL